MKKICQKFWQIFFMVDDAKSGVLGGVAVFAIVTCEPRGF